MTLRKSVFPTASQFDPKGMAQASQQEEEPNRGPKQDTKKNGKTRAHTIPAQMF